MVARQRCSNGTLALLQCAASIGHGTLPRMHSIATTESVPAQAAPVPTVAWLQANLAALEAERHETRQELVDLKRKPFTARSQSDTTTPAKPLGRPLGHAGSSR